MIPCPNLPFPRHFLATRSTSSLEITQSIKYYCLPPLIQDSLDGGKKERSCSNFK